MLNFLTLNILRQATDWAHDAGGDQADKRAHDDDHDRLDDGAEAGDGGVDFFFVKVSDFDEDCISLAGFFADGQHLGDDWRE